MLCGLHLQAAINPLVGMEEYALFNTVKVHC